ncbi:MAG TPA: hypothetical protein PLD47_16070 [Aggregatilineales bacterium]|nr:hypothetical protein [Anaerolineales bacterium]HRE49245.1 hypothetical protein [Aggregatilineales bacterium]
MCRRTGALALLILFIPLAFCSIAFASVSTWILDRGFYLNLLDNDAIYEAFLSDELSADLKLTTSGGASALPPEAVLAGLRTVLTPAYLRGEVTRNVGSFFDLLEGKAESVTFSLDLRPIKSALVDEKKAAFASAYVGALKPCTGTTTTSDLPVCLPANMTAETLTADIEQGMTTVVAGMPNSIDFSDQITAGRNNPFTELREVLPALTGSLVTILAPMVALWLLIGILGGITTREFFLWLGVSLFIPAGLVALMGGALGGNIKNAIETTFATTNSSLSATTQQMLATIGTTAGTKVGEGFLNYGVIGVIVSVVLIALGLLLRPRKPILSMDNYDTYGEKKKKNEGF